ncbi:hypothetical protein PR048_015278 [Dryococelus australis]|uniref:Uncharacterized protein n=1 Tax=Dryococelus australis TaxID=614101 RepID=A0ABQ9HGS6_9NEOP|nr:hypothetical protein PR048_015278 [Dryococelus australis]
MVHFELPKLAVRDLDPRSAAIVDICSLKIRQQIELQGMFFGRRICCRAVTGYRRAIFEETIAQTYAGHCSDIASTFICSLIVYRKRLYLLTWASFEKDTSAVSTCGKKVIYTAAPRSCRQFGRHLYKRLACKLETVGSKNLYEYRNHSAAIHVKAVHDNVSTFEINPRKMSLLLPANIVTDAPTLPGIRTQSLPHPRSVAHEPTAPREIGGVLSTQLRSEAPVAGGGLSASKHRRCGRGAAKVGNKCRHIVLNSRVARGRRGDKATVCASTSTRLSAGTTLSLWRRTSKETIRATLERTSNGLPLFGARGSSTYTHVPRGWIYSRAPCCYRTCRVDVPGRWRCRRPEMVTGRHDNGRVCSGGRGGRTVRLLAYHRGEPGSTPYGVTPEFSLVRNGEGVALVGGFSRYAAVSPALALCRCSIFASFRITNY